MEHLEDKEIQSPLYYYVCQHGASNDPCPIDFPGAEPMLENWYETYEEEHPAQGISDQTNLNAKTTE